MDDQISGTLLPTITPTLINCISYCEAREVGKLKKILVRRRIFLLISPGKPIALVVRRSNI
jgi:hypothetical protein